MVLLQVGANMRFVLPNSTQVARPIVHRGGIQVPAVPVASVLFVS